MRIERTVIDLARLEAFDFTEALGQLGFGNIERLGLVGSPCDHPLPAAVAGDPVAIGCVVGRTEEGADALIALTFDGKSIGHYTVPHSDDSAVPLLTAE